MKVDDAEPVPAEREREKQRETEREEGGKKKHLPVSEAEDTAAILSVEPLASSSSGPLLRLLLASTVDSFPLASSESEVAYTGLLLGSCFHFKPHSTAVLLTSSSVS